LIAGKFKVYFTISRIQTNRTEKLNVQNLLSFVILLSKIDFFESRKIKLEVKAIDLQGLEI